MTLRVLSSSSQGNCYIFTDKEGNILILEAGIEFKQIGIGIRWKFGKVCGCLISHRHTDHARAVPALLSHGVHVYATKDLFQNLELGILNYDLGVRNLELGVNNSKLQTQNREATIPNSKFLIPKSKFACVHPIRNDGILEGRADYLSIGPYRVVPFDCIHDVPCTGYLIVHEEMGSCFFATDTVACRYPFQHCNHIMIEANYEHSILTERINAGETPAKIRPRLMNSHMEITQTLQFLRAMGTKNCKEIILVHLSPLNSDPKLFQQAVQQDTGVKTYIAKPGLTLQLSL